MKNKALQTLELLLEAKFGPLDSDRGCYVNGEWLSLKAIVDLINCANEHSEKNPQRSKGMKKYTFAAYDRKGRLVELKVISETKGEADKMARAIFHSAFEFIDTDEGIFLNDEEDYT